MRKPYESFTLAVKLLDMDLSEAMRTLERDADENTGKCLPDAKRYLEWLNDSAKYNLQMAYDDIIDSVASVSAALSTIKEMHDKANDRITKVAEEKHRELTEQESIKKIFTAGCACGIELAKNVFDAFFISDKKEVNA